MKVRRFSFALLFISVVFMSSVYAEDIVYVVKDTSKVNHDFLNSIQDLGLTVSVVDDDNINSLNLSKYKMMLVGNNRFSNPQDIPVNNFPALIVNQYHMSDWYWASGVSFVSSSNPLTAKNFYDNPIAKNIPSTFQVYYSCCSGFSSIPMYYLSKEKRSLKLKGITSTMSDNLNLVVATATKGTVLRLGHVSNSKSVFFGITESYMWTEDAESLFKNSILWLVNEPPILNSTIPPISFNEDSVFVNAYDLSQYFHDKENDSITYSVVSSANIKANLTGSMVTLSASKDWSGIEYLKFVASDLDQSRESNQVAVTVKPVNDLPVLQSYASDLTFVETQYVNLKMSASDVDNDTVSITYSLPLNPQGIWQTDLSSAGNYSVEVLADDFHGGTDKKVLSLNVLPKVYINEFSSGWVELYNPHDYDLSLDSWILSSPSKSLTLSSVIKAKGFLVLNLNLSDNDFLALKSANTVVDSVAFGSFNDGNLADNAPSLSSQKSMGRRSDGYSSGADKFNFVAFDVPTDGLSNLADVTPPVVTLVAPADAFVLSSLPRDITLSFYVSDNSAAELDCVFLFGDQVLSPASTVKARSSSLQTFVLSSLTDSSYSWNVKCFDGRNYASAQSNRRFVVDVNDPPIITSFSPLESNLETEEAKPITFTHQSADPEGLSLSYAWSVDNVDLAFTKDFVYNPSYFSSGNHKVMLVVKDSGNMNSVKEWDVRVSNVNRLPYSSLGVPVQVFEEDKSFNLALGAYFADDDNETLSYRVVREDTNKVDCNVLLGKLYINPLKDFNGKASCGIVANDGLDDSSEVLVLMDILPINDAPELVGFIPNQVWDEDSVAVDKLNLNDYFSDVDSDVLTYSVSGNSNIIVNVNSAVVSFSQPADWFGSETVTFTASDGILSLNSNDLSLIVKSVNDPPELLSPIDPQLFDEDSSSSLDLSSYFFDKEHDSLTYKVISKDSAKVDCSVSGNTLNLLPKHDFYGSASCALAANDSSSDSEPVVLSLTITPVNDDPVLKQNIPSLTWDEDSSPSAVIDLDDYFVDVDNGVLTYSFSGNSQISVVLGSDNKVSFSQPDNWFGSETVMFTVSDGSSSASSDMLLVVVDVNEPPVMSEVQTQNILEDSSFNHVFLEASDVDGFIDEFYVIDEDLSRVDCSISGSTLSLVPSKDFFGEASCGIGVRDGDGSSDSKLILIMVENVNDDPIIDSFFPSANLLITEDGSQKFSVLYHDVDNSSVLVDWYVDGILIASGSSFDYAASGKGVFEIKAVVSDSEASVSKSWSVNATDCPLTNVFDGSTTDFCSLSQDKLSNLDCAVLERSGYGKMDFCGSTIDFANILSFDKFISVSRGFVALNYNELSSFVNKPASITLYNINSDEVPKIYYSPSFTLDPNLVSLPCPSSVCSDIKFEGNTLKFKASRISAFKVIPSFVDNNDKPGVRTCSDSNGYVCTAAQACGSSWLSASDTSYCCSVACSSGSSSDNDNLANDSSAGIDSCIIGQVGDLNLDIKNPDEGDSLNLGDPVNVEIKVDNDADEDLEVVVKSVLYDLDDSEEVDSDSETLSLDSHDSDTLTFSLSIPNNIKDNHDFIIHAKVFEKGMEEANCDENSFDVKLKREKHKVSIKKAKISASALSCVSSFELPFEVENLGKNDESVYFTVSQPSLGLAYSSGKFDLDKDDDVSKSVSIKIPDNSTPGSYPVELKVLFDNGGLSDSSILNLRVGECGEKSDISLAGSEPVVQDDIGKIDILKSSFRVEKGGSVAIPLRVTNMKEEKVTFSVGSISSSSYTSFSDVKDITLSPGSSSTVYLYVSSRPDSPAGKKLVPVQLKVNGLVVDSSSASVEITSSDNAKDNFALPSNMSLNTLVMVLFTGFLLVFFVVSFAWSSSKRKHRFHPPKSSPKHL